MGAWSRLHGPGRSVSVARYDGGGRPPRRPGARRWSGRATRGMTIVAVGNERGLHETAPRRGAVLRRARGGGLLRALAGRERAAAAREGSAPRWSAASGAWPRSSGGARPPGGIRAPAGPTRHAGGGVQGAREPCRTALAAGNHAADGPRGLAPRRRAGREPLPQPRGRARPPPHPCHRGRGAARARSPGPRARTTPTAAARRRNTTHRRSCGRSWATGRDQAAR